MLHNKHMLFAVVDARGRSDKSSKMTCFHFKDYDDTLFLQPTIEEMRIIFGEAATEKSGLQNSSWKQNSQSIVFMLKNG